MLDVLIRKESDFADRFDSVLIKSDEICENSYYFSCTPAPEKRRYIVRLYVVDACDTDVALVNLNMLIWSTDFYAIDDLNKRGILSSMLETIIEQDRVDPVILYEQYGGQINDELYESSGEDRVCSSPVSIYSERKAS